MLISIYNLLKKILPNSIFDTIRSIYHLYKRKQYLIFGRKYHPAETSKAKGRRMKEGFYDKYIKGKGLDIGYGGDPIAPNCDVWDFEHGDAQFLEGVSENKYDYVYSSHTLEHMVDPSVALHNWFRVVKPGGYLIIYIPHRDLYEKKKELPSRFNEDHKHYFLPTDSEAPNTIGIKNLIEKDLFNFEIIYIKECNENFVSNGPDSHSQGEFSIEAVVRKL